MGTPLFFYQNAQHGLKWILNTTFLLIVLASGYELMKEKESAKNLFRLITCRNLDMNKLKAVCFDHACSLHACAMNREAREFEYVKTIVDSLHWKNHISCSSGFNAKIYKKTLLSSLNSQSREQTNAKLARLKPSLRMMSYENFMIMSRIFFLINNMRSNRTI